MDLPLLPRLFAAALIAGSAVIAGHRLHRWLFYAHPRIGRRLPSDTGAWSGLAAAILFLTLTGCQTSRPAGPSLAAAPTAGMATLAITRTSDPLYIGAPARITVNGSEVGSLWRGESTSVPTPPGRTTVAVDTWSIAGSSSIAIDVQAGQTYRLTVAPRPENTVAGVVGGAVAQGLEGGGAFSISQ